MRADHAQFFSRNCALICVYNPWVNIKRHRSARKLTANRRNASLQLLNWILDKQKMDLVLQFTSSTDIISWSRHLTLNSTHIIVHSILRCRHTSSPQLRKRLRYCLLRTYMLFISFPLYFGRTTRETWRGNMIVNLGSLDERQGRKSSRVQSIRSSSSCIEQTRWNWPWSSVPWISVKGSMEKETMLLFSPS